MKNIFVFNAIQIANILSTKGVILFKITAFIPWETKIYELVV